MTKQPPGNPFPYGIVIIDTPGTVKKLTSTIESTYADANDLACQSLLITATDTNIGAIYIGTQVMVRATGVGVMFKLGPGQSIPINSQALNSIRPERYYIDADNATDSASSAGFIA